MDFDLLDHGSGEVLPISTSFGMDASGGLSKWESINLLDARKNRRSQ